MSNLPIQDLQIKQTFLERHIEEQDRVIHAMRSDIEKLRKEVERLTERTDADASTEGDLPAHEKPPHY